MSRERYFHLTSQQMVEIRKRYPYPLQNISKEMSRDARRYGLSGRQLLQVVHHDWIIQRRRDWKRLGRE